MLSDSGNNQRQINRRLFQLIQSGSNKELFVSNHNII